MNNNDSYLLRGLDSNMKIFKTFNIDTTQMHMFRTKEEMQEFLVNYMKTSLHNNVQQLEGKKILEILCRPGVPETEENKGLPNRF